MNRAQALSKLNRSDMRNAAAERDATTVHMEPRALDWHGCTDSGVAATAVELINVSHARRGS